MNKLEKLDIALSLIIDTESVDRVYACETEEEIEELIIDLKLEGKL